MHKKAAVWGIIALVCILAIGIIYFEKSIIPIDPDSIVRIEFRVYPHEGPVFGVEDADVIKEITKCLNELDYKKSTQTPRNGDDHYFYFVLVGENNINVELDDAIIMLNRQRFEIDGTNICAFLEQICAKQLPQQ